MVAPINRQTVIDYYSNDFIASELLHNATSREVAGALFTGAYEKRPNILQYKSDVAQMVQRGVTSFHYSVEHWRYPMQLGRENYEELRTGWDMIFDIDSKLGMDEAKLTAQLVCNFLEKYGIKNYGIKFSGSRGFHVCVPWTSFPKEVDYAPLAQRYPNVPRLIATFVRRGVKKDLLDQLIKMKGSVKELLAVLDQPPSELSPFYFVDIEKNWGARHMFRAPFSLNEKKWLCSIPLTRSELDSFTIKDAHPLYVMKRAEQKNFPAFFSGKEGEAMQLLGDVMDWYATNKKEAPKTAPKKQIVNEEKISEQFFPPCIKLILNGLSDGRKRSMFTLVHFLRLMNWPWQDIESRVFEWNDKNKTPLPQNIIIAHLRWAEQNRLNPANCTNDSFYKSIGICNPDNICKAGTANIAIKNPIAYPFKRLRSIVKKKPEKHFLQQFSCMRCDKKFRSARSLAIHKSRVHQIYE